MNTRFERFDSPHLIRREELLDSIRLFRICFGGPEIEDGEEVLTNYVPPRWGGTYALSHDGKPVSQISVFHDQLRMYDGTIRAGSIGGVCTHPDYRGQGLASHLLKHCAQQLVNEGARLMLISGDGEVYTRLGNVLQGKYMTFSIQPDQISQRKSTPSDLVIRRATDADILVCCQLYQAEPIHFVRRVSDFSAALHDPTRNTYIHADQWIIERAGRAVAYLFLGFQWGAPDEPSSGIRHVGEYAGSRVALADAISVVMTTGGLKDLTWQVPWQDTELIQLLRDSGYAGSMTNLDGYTLRIIDLPGFIKDLRPFLQARLDKNLLRGLRFEQNGPLLGGIGDDRYTITRGRDRLELDGAAMTLLAMGNADPQAEAVHASGTLAEVISALFPLPSFLPGLNYH